MFPSSYLDFVGGRAEPLDVDLVLVLLVAHLLDEVGSLLFVFEQVLQLVVT